MIKFLLSLSTVLAISCSGYGQSKGKGTPATEPVPTDSLDKPPQTLEEKMIQRNIEISEWFDGVADGIDLFLVGSRVEKKTKNPTRVLVENITYSEERKSLKNNTSIGIFPRFPNLEKYWSLKFTTYDEKEDRRNVRNNYIAQNPRRKNYGATAAWYRKFGNIRTSFEPRIELQDPLRISHSLSFESIADFGAYEVNPKLELYASARRGPGTFQALNVNIHLTKKLSLTLINEGDYLDKTRLYNVNHGFSFGHILTRKTSMSYSLIANYQNRPHYHLEGYTASISWNEMIYKKIFDYSLTPYVQYLKTNSFKGKVGGILNLRFNF